MLADKRIIGRVGNFFVHGTVHEVQLQDGTLHRLQPVSKSGIPNHYLRALQVGNGRHVCIFDLRKFVPALGAEIPAAPERDKPGLVAMSLRARFDSAIAFRAAIGEEFEVVAEPEEELEAAAA
jgi:hypothetical protein